MNTYLLVILDHERVFLINSNKLAFLKHLPFARCCTNDSGKFLQMIITIAQDMFPGSGGFKTY